MNPDLPPSDADGPPADGLGPGSPTLDFSAGRLGKEPTEPHSPPSPAGSPPTAADRAVGRKLGEYRIVREIGRGGMGTVYEAVQETLGRKVALKVLRGS